MMKFYQYPKCSTCRKAVKFLKDNELQFESLDITEQPPTVAELQTMLDSYDGNIKKLFNTSGVQYRELDMKNKLPSMNAQQGIDLLASNGKLIKRPFLLNSSPKAIQQGLVGYNEAVWQTFTQGL